VLLHLLLVPPLVPLLVLLLLLRVLLPRFLPPVRPPRPLLLLLLLPPPSLACLVPPQAWVLRCPWLQWRQALLQQQTRRRPASQREAFPARLR
jgi:hypothetical protein